MLEERMDDAIKRAIREPTPPRWKGVRSLGPVHQFNERCLELLGDIAASEEEFALSLITEHRRLWTSLDVAARQRLARMPFVLADAHFDAEDRWREMVASTSGAVRREVMSNGLPKEAGENLMHELMMFAWQTARWDRSVALMCFGMAPSVISIISALTPHQVLTVVSRESASVRVRWANDLQFWEDLLLAALSGDEKKLVALHLHGKLTFCGLLNSRPDGRSPA
jgi:hypothetical protein